MISVPCDPVLINVGRIPNPLRLTIIAVGLGLCQVNLANRDRVYRTADLAWPRILTGLARMSKIAVDIAMVGVAVGPAAIAGLGFAGPYWAFTFVLGGGIATGTIALVSQRYGAKSFDLLDQAVRTSVFLVLLATLPITLVLWVFPVELIALLTGDERSIELGAAYLQVIAIGMPFGGLNLVASRILIGADDAWSPMILRAGGAVTNIVLNAVLIFGFGMGVVGAALGTVFANVAISVAFVTGLYYGRLPFIGALPVTISFRGRYAHQETILDLVTICLPAIGRRLVWVVARFPMLAFVALFGPIVVAAYVISRRLWGLMNTPGWGFGLAASSLVGQSLGEGDEDTAEAYGHEIARISVLTYVILAILIFIFAEPIVRLFVDDPTGDTIAVAVPLVYATCLAVVARGIGGTYEGALDATGDTRWPFYSRLVGMFGLAIPLTYLGATTPLGLYGLYLAYFGESLTPAIMNGYRFSTGKWKMISQQYRPDTTPTTD